MYKKQRLIGIEGSEDRLPPKLVTTGFFRRKGITNPAVICHEGKLLIFARLIYHDGEGNNSAIVRYKAKITDDGLVRVLEDSEETIFAPEKPHGYRGVEDFRVATITGEKVVHAFLVHHDGHNARTEYKRSEEDPINFSFWHSFGVWFPNISANKAIELVPVKRYKKIWDKAHGKVSLEEKIRFGLPIPKNQLFLGTKDCSLWPRKVKRVGEDGVEREKYGVIIRLLPDIQIVYVSDFLELASYQFWRQNIKNIDKHSLLKREYKWEKSHIGLAGQPLEINEGTLIFYHGAIMHPKKKYAAGAALADPNNPQKIIARTPKPIIEATEPWEKEKGVINHGGVVFPTAHILSKDGKNITHFYGASDRSIGCITIPLKEILYKMESV